ncbi:MAG: hypothetical protein AUK48_03240 [Oscillatoriales cyanobacterium CG2_30_44_21]|nr:MAG: hypothetical protein AUK48_03240 [Oscillatoriales cyanobacterium CG2_30_44_21]
MKWYAEFSHYRKELGDILLQVMFSYPVRPLNVPVDFGVQLNKDNIEAHLIKIREDRAKYLQTSSQEVLQLENTISEVKLSYQKSLQEERQKQCLDFGKCK